MEWTDIFSGPAFEPVKSRELHLGKDCDLSRPLVVRDTDKLTVEVAGGAALRLVVLHTKPCQAEIRIKLLEGADAELVQLFSAEAFVDFQVEQAAGSKFRMTACQFTSANVRYRFDLNGREASNELDVLFLDGLTSGGDIAEQEQARQPRGKPQHGAAHLSFEAKLARGASLHWLPQETILFQGAHLDRETRVEDAAHRLAGRDFFSLPSRIFCLPVGREGRTRPSQMLTASLCSVNSFALALPLDRNLLFGH